MHPCDDGGDIFGGEGWPCEAIVEHEGGDEQEANLKDEPPPPPAE